MPCRFGRFQLDAANAQLWQDDEPLKVRPKSFDVLVHLVARAGELVSTKELLDSVWADITVGDAVVKVSIRELRKLFGETGREPQYIATVHRRGYRFIAPVTSPIQPEAAPLPMASPHSSLVVLPFLNLSDEQAYAYMADGLTEDLTTQLARVPGFFVIARSTAFAYKGQSPNVRHVAEELGVRYVVEGSVRPLGNRVRVTAQLIEAASGNHLWADHYDGQTDDDFDIQDQLLRALIGQLEPELARAEIIRLDRRPPAQWDAWDWYRQADGLPIVKGWHEDTFSEGATLLRQAIALDPDFALAHARLALLLAFGRRVGLVKNREATTEEALNVGNRALDLDGTRSEVQSYVGCAFTDLGQLRQGLELTEQAVITNPSNSQAWATLGAALIAGGETDRGVELIRHGIRLSPKDHRLAVWRCPLAFGLLQLGRGEEAVEEGRLACRNDSRFYPAQITLTAILAYLRQMDQAAEMLAEARRLRPALSVAEIKLLIGQRATKGLVKTGLLDDMPQTTL
jgi:adenylate cyclase